MKLNPAKFAFEVGFRKSLDFLVSNKGIDLKSNKIKPIKDI